MTQTSSSKEGTFIWKNNELMLSCGCWVHFDNGGVWSIFEGEACHMHAYREGWRDDKPDKCKLCKIGARH